MKHFGKRVAGLSLAAAMALSLTACGSTPADKSAPAGSSSSAGSAVTLGTPPGDPATIPDGLDIDWNHRYHFEELEGQLDKLAETYPNITKKYSIGTSWQERDLWCLEITNEATGKDGKTGIGVFANIHGDERESAASAMYTAWWTLLNSEDDYVKKMLDHYVLYVVPVINPDGYEQSFTIKIRQNLRPTDNNGDRVPFNDPYNDLDGDGYISRLYRGTADMDPAHSDKLPAGMARFGMESSDWDGNGVLGDDPLDSGIDMNRTFEYLWNRYDVTTDVEGKDVIGGDAGTWNGSGPATEPEIQAIQNFLKKTPMDALVSIHTNIQAVLYPWCYRNYDANSPDDAEIPFMKETSEKMAAAMSETTGRPYYSLNSWADYPTAAEMIDYAFGKFGIHSYTIECYCGGTSEQNDGSKYVWGNEMPEPTWVFHSQDELRSFGLDPEKLVDKDGKGLAPNEGLWFYTSSYTMNDDAPADQELLVKGARDAILVMIESEPHGEGYHLPDYMM